MIDDRTYENSDAANADRDNSAADRIEVEVLIPDNSEAASAANVAEDANTEDVAANLGSEREMRRRNAEQTLAKIAELRLKRSVATVQKENVDELTADSAAEQNDVVIDAPSPYPTDILTVSNSEEEMTCQNAPEEQAMEPNNTNVDIENTVAPDGASGTADAIAREYVHDEPANVVTDVDDAAPVVKEQPVQAPPVYTCSAPVVYPYIPVYAEGAKAIGVSSPASYEKQLDKLGAREAKKKRNDEVSMKDLLAIFAPKLWIIALCAVLLSILLGGYAMFFKRDTYTSKATFMISTTSGSVTDSDLNLSYKMIDIIDVHVSREDFLHSVADTINNTYKNKGWKVTAKELKNAISITKLNEDAPAFTLSITTGDDIKSLAISEILCEYLAPTEVTDETVTLVGDFMHPSYARVTMRKIDSPELGGVNDKGVLTNAIIGFLGGAVASMVVVYMIAMFDVVIHDRKKLEDHFGLPILGVIPRYDSAANGGAKGGNVK